MTPRPTKERLAEIRDHFADRFVCATTSVRRTVADLFAEIRELAAERDEARQIAKKLRQYIPDDDGSLACDFKMDAWRRPHSQAKGWPGCGWCPDHTVDGTCTVCGMVRT